MNTRFDIFDIDNAFLAEIELFLKNTGMSASEFGKKFMHDPGFVFALRSGERSSTAKTIKKVIGKISEHTSPTREAG